MNTYARAQMILLLCATPASGAFVGGTFFADAAGSAAATSVLGAPTTVHQLYIAFDEADDILNSIGNADFSTSVPGTHFVHNGLFGANPDTDAGVNDAAFGAFPESEWDTYVGIGGPLFGDSNATTDTDFAFTSNGVQGGWFDIPGDDGMGNVTRTGLAGDGIMSGGLFLVWGGQFVVQGAGVTDARGGEIFVGDGFISSGGLYAGFLDVNWIDALGGPNIPENNVFVSLNPPAPGTAALFGLAGLAASRRRRGQATQEGTL